jgi:hypothetical protein
MVKLSYEFICECAIRACFHTNFYSLPQQVKYLICVVFNVSVSSSECAVSNGRTYGQTLNLGPS